MSQHTWLNSHLAKQRETWTNHAAFDAQSADTWSSVGQWAATRVCQHDPTFLLSLLWETRANMPLVERLADCFELYQEKVELIVFGLNHCLVRSRVSKIFWTQHDLAACRLDGQSYMTHVSRPNFDLCPRSTLEPVFCVRHNICLSCTESRII